MWFVYIASPVSTRRVPVSVAQPHVRRLSTRTVIAGMPAAFLSRLRRHHHHRTLSPTPTPFPDAGCHDIASDARLCAGCQLYPIVYATSMPRLCQVTRYVSDSSIYTGNMYEWIPATESTLLLTYPIAPLLTRIHLSLLDSRAIRPTITRHRPARQRS